MATVVDALVVTLGIDAKAYKSGIDGVTKDQKTLRDESAKTAVELEARGKQAAQFFSSIKNEALGLIGVLLGGKGIEAFARSATIALAQVGREALNIGISVQGLTAFQNLIVRNGGSAEAATNSLKGYADAIERFKIYGDPKILPFLSAIGADVNTGPLEAVMKALKYIEENKNLPDGILRIRQILGGLGFDEGLINSLIQIGSVKKALDGLKESYALGVPTDEMIKRTQQLQHDWEAMRHAAYHLGNTILTNLQPALSGVLNWTKEMIVNNPDAVTKIGEIAAALGLLASASKAASFLGLTTIATGLERILLAARGLSALGILYFALKPSQGAGQAELDFERKRLEELGKTNPDPDDTEPKYRFRQFWEDIERRWQENAPIGLGGGYRSGEGAGSSGSAPSGDAASRGKFLLDYYMSPAGGGYTREQALGIIGWIGEETGGTLNPQSFNPDGGGQGAQGALQLRGPRVDRFRAMYGHDPRYGTLAEQAEYSAWELSHTERSSDAALRGTTNRADAAREIALRFGRPDPSQYDAVTNNAQKYANRFDAALLPGAATRAGGGVGSPSLGSASAASGVGTGSSVSIGTVIIQTPSTDPAAHAKAFSDHLADELTNQSNRGLQ